MHIVLLNCVPRSLLKEKLHAPYVSMLIASELKIS